MPRPPDPLVGDGILLLDKPGGMTSHDVVARCRRICGTRKVGHAGTLDPMATGLLVVGVNRATRLLTFFVGSDKSYEATIRLGLATSTDDADGEPFGRTDASGLSDGEIDAAVGRLTGEIDQVPSAVSAIKVAGVRSYTRARAGQDVELAARRVRIARFDVLTRREGPAGCVDVDVEVEVSSGTYVRALARDLGADLGVGGHLTALRRVRVGGFTVADAHLPQELEHARSQAAPGESGLPLIDLGSAARSALPTWELEEDEARFLGHGVRLPAPELGGQGPWAACDRQGRLVAVVARRGDRVDVRAVFV